MEEARQRESERVGTELGRALAYVAAWRGRRVVVKLGGRALEEGGLGTLFSDLVLLHQAGLLPVLVHGGGPEISRQLDGLGIEARFVDGLRVTDEAAMQVVEMVLAGSVNKRLVRDLQRQGGRAVGISGRDGAMIRVEPHRRSELGFVGEVVEVDVELLEQLLTGGFLPVVATLGLGPEGRSYNVNADTAAAALAVALRAEKFLLLTDVPGISRPQEDGKTRLVSRLSPKEAADLISTGVVSSGMIPKVKACLHALAGGVPSAHVVAAGLPHSLLVELFTDRGIGTMIRETENQDGDAAARRAVGEDLP